jgi:hypothetical protein
VPRNQTGLNRRTGGIGRHKILEVGSTNQAAGVAPEEKDLCSGSMYQGKDTRRHLKPGRPTLPGHLDWEAEETRDMGHEGDEMWVPGSKYRTLQG